MVVRVSSLNGWTVLVTVGNYTRIYDIGFVGV